MDHALRHRAQNADVATATPRIAGRAPGGAGPRDGGAVDDPEPDEA
ncbi:MAG TPA: chorismate synthase, partial [Casimicrobiaceae bacterium]|nr:chorismate synthase [Casimicrobiaceae bacterium]